ncbi:MAG: LysM peptidoglycan-binding domain-containing protein, partial [Candidatus Aenigmarchaeota archaeon]|nr:LysM peptidoglycan-binding domain-containing protein [Candidatus Aenigmarchaeota archaeon]
DKINSNDLGEGNYLCFQFKSEQFNRCSKMRCRTKLPYMGALEDYNDFQIAVNKILGRPLVKEYEVRFKRTINAINLELPTTTTIPEQTIHTVQTGETLSDIAQKYGVTVDAIKQANGLIDDTIDPGQKLVIPSGSTTTIPTGTTVPPRTCDMNMACRSKLGIQTQFQKHGVMEFIETTKPAVVRLMGGFDRTAEIKQKSPCTFIVGINWDTSFPDKNGDPSIKAQEWFDKNHENIKNSFIDCWEGYNEFVPDRDKAEQEMRWFSQFEIKRMQLLESIGKKACIGTFSTGNPPEFNWWLYFKDAVDYATKNGHYLSLHEYDSPRMNTNFGSDGMGWTTGRYRRVYSMFGFSLPLVITESGIDSGGCPGTCGWRSHTDANSYIEDLKWYDSVLKQDSYVIGAAIFHYGQYGWESFEIHPELIGDNGNNGPLVSYMNSLTC